MKIKLNSVKYLIYVIIIISIFLLFYLNIEKYRNPLVEVKPVFSEIENNYFRSENEIFTKLKKWTNPEEIIFKLAKIKINIPVTYLRREIFLLGFYTPPKLKEPTQTIYESDNTNSENIEEENFNRDNFIQLKFDLRERDDLKEVKIEEVREEKKEQNKQSEKKSKNESSREEYSPSDEPEIAVYHTHTSETYIDDPRIDNNFRVAQGEIGNIGKVGQHFSYILSNKYNIKVYHTTKVHDKIFRNSYGESEKTAKNIVKQFSDLKMVFDFHRDALDSDGKKAYTTTINQKKVAKIMIVVTNGELYSDLNVRKPEWDWNKNYQFAQKLAQKMEEMYPGLLLGEVKTRNTIFNQHLHKRALLLEIGDRNNTTAEALEQQSFWLMW
ncbi:MAG: stage II sporulation protein P [Bacillota bacterium]